MSRGDGMEQVTIVARLDKARSEVGVNEGGRWVVRKRTATYSADDGAGLVPFVSCLEESVEDLRVTLAAGIARCGLDVSLLESFPFSDIAAEGISSRSPKWISLAVAWLDGVRLSERLVGALTQLIQRREGTQRERQQAWRRLQKG